MFWFCLFGANATTNKTANLEKICLSLTRFELLAGHDHQLSFTLLQQVPPGFHSLQLVRSPPHAGDSRGNISKSRLRQCFSASNPAPQPLSSTNAGFIAAPEQQRKAYYESLQTTLPHPLAGYTVVIISSLLKEKNTPWVAIASLDNSNGSTSWHPTTTHSPLDTIVV